MADVISAMNKLDTWAIELDGLSKDLAKVARALEPVAVEYDRFLEDFETGLWDASQSDDSVKLPPEAIRVKLAMRAMPAELRGKYSALSASQERMKKRIADVKALVEAQRSILSALKVEQEASGSGLRAVS